MIERETDRERMLLCGSKKNLKYIRVINTKQGIVRLRGRPSQYG
jgi:hypothetical protein